ncbi:LysR family transcriptional regulator substrate-binding protein [Paucilactobacillus wasatchensis]|nr:LysR family transcriptional regulator substrate-binding protein [Paucilactobacillus wasatchensis]
MSKLENRSIDIGIIRDLQLNQMKFTDYQVVTADEDELMAIVPAHSDLALKSEISVTDLLNQNLISLNRGSGIFEKISELFEQAGFTPRISFYSTHINTIMGIVNSEQHVTFLFKKSAQPFMTDHLVMRPIAPRIFSKLQIVVSPSKNAAVSQLFVKYFNNFNFEP